MTEIGINENLVLSPDTNVTEKGGIEVHLKEGGDNKNASLLDALEDTDTVLSDGSKILMFPPNIKDHEDKPKSAYALVKELKQAHMVFFKIFSLYDTKDNILKTFSPKLMFEGINITPENEAVMLTNESIINKMFENLGKAVVAYITANALDSKEAFRIKLIRQSKKKAFPKFTFSPEREDWVELMSIPKDKTKVKFSSYEISKGLNDATLIEDVVEEEEDNAFVEEVEEAIVVEEEKTPFD